MDVIATTFGVAGAIILSLGGGGAIILGLSNWLGKVWADRLMETERAKHSAALERFRDELRRETEKELSAAKNELDIYKEKHLKGYSDKIQIYRLVVDVVSEFLGDLDFVYATAQLPPNAAERLDKFNRDRMKAYGYLAMLAPQNVMDAFDALIDHLILVRNGGERYEWQAVRNLAIAMINQVRNDIGMDVTPIQYRGRL